MSENGARLRRRAITGMAVLATIGVAACGGSASSNPLGGGGASKGTVVIGSANFPENEVLAKIYSLALTAKGVKVTEKFNISTREVYYPEVKRGAISIIPEYNGTLLTVAVDSKSTAKTTAEVNAALKAGLPSSLEILDSASAADSDSVTVTKAFADANHLTTIGDLKPLAASMVFGGPPEFSTRADGLAGLKASYGLVFKGFDPLDESGPITLKALTSGQVQAADLFTTNPQIITDNLVVLTDTAPNFAAQNVTPLVYKKAMTPTIIATLNAISAKLTTQALLTMNKEIIIDHSTYQTVAASWLKSVGLPGGA